ncbi:hypothetical protein [Niastella sp. OAS944]|uniref:hypothetical protein n=1 Tax=Niastella sp. OAS944 TaxID=2664089 RepID=UPI0034823E0E|nr:hypothetical protein [Chitinophagaceae bacterium OAS944]
MDKLDIYSEIYGKLDQREEWKAFFQTRDWYDMPDYVKENDRIYEYNESIMPFSPKRIEWRFYILPKDIEYIFDYSPEDARSILNDIRIVLEIPISGPVTYPDLQEYTKLDLETILDFIMAS